MAPQAPCERRRREDRGAVGAEGVGAGGCIPLPHQLGGLGERCELPQWGPGRSPGRFRFYNILNDCLSFWLRQNAGFVMYSMLQILSFFGMLLCNVECELHPGEKVFVEVSIMTWRQMIINFVC